jgi:hypothetical protein
MRVARYQHEHIKKVSRSGGGFAWKYQYRQTDPDGMRRIKSQTFTSDKYKKNRPSAMLSLSLFTPTDRRFLIRMLLIGAQAFPLQEKERPSPCAMN